MYDWLNFSPGLASVLLDVGVAYTTGLGTLYPLGPWSVDVDDATRSPLGCRVVARPGSAAELRPGLTCGLGGHASPPVLFCGVEVQPSSPGRTGFLPAALLFFFLIGGSANISAEC